MGNLEADLAAIEIGLESGDYERALNCLNRLKSENSSYLQEDSGYLVDYYLGQAIFRREMDSRQKPEELIKARQYFEDSLKLNPNFADSHTLAGYVSMVLANHPAHNDTVYCTLDSQYHLKRAIEIKPTLSEELSSKIHLLEQDLSLIPDVVLCSIHEDMVLEWMVEFEKFPWVKINHGNITKQSADAIVSPANSFGFMDGGLDNALREYFGWDLQEKLQKRIKEKHNGELIVGTAEIVETGKPEIPYLISAPTMRVPMEIKDTMNPYLATRAVFLEIDSFNLDSLRIQSVLVPSMGTGVGKVPFDVAARQMRAAYEEVVLRRSTFPKDFGDAQQKHRVLSMNHYHKLYSGKY